MLEVLRWTTARFSQRQVPTARLDAEVLVAHALGLTRVQLYVQFDRPLEATELTAMRELVKRRQAGESVAYITGKKEFFGLELDVDARVLVPRPDTETLVDEALARLASVVDGVEPARAPRVADVGTGSGAVAIAIAKTAVKAAAKSKATATAATAAERAATATATATTTATTATTTTTTTTGEAAAETPARARPAPEVVASDISPDALALARGNAQRHDVAITFVEGDLDAPLRPFAPFDLIAANLPYIPSADIQSLAAEVRAEPWLALDGGADGLALLRRLVAAASDLLRAGGALALEVGAGQAPATAALLTAAGFTDVRLRRDLGGIDRVVSGVKA